MILIHLEIMKIVKVGVSHSGGVPGRLPSKAVEYRDRELLRGPYKEGGYMIIPDSWDELAV